MKEDATIVLFFVVMAVLIGLLAKIPDTPGPDSEFTHQHVMHRYGR